MAMSREEANRRFDAFFRHFDRATAERLSQSGLDPREDQGKRILIEMRAANQIARDRDKRFRRTGKFSEANKRVGLNILRARAEANQIRHARIVKQTESRLIRQGVDPRIARQRARQRPDLRRGVLDNYIDIWRAYDIFAA